MKTRSNIAGVHRAWVSEKRLCGVIVLTAAIMLVSVNARAAAARLQLGGVAAAAGSTLLMPVSYQEGDSGGATVLLLRLRIPLVQVELLEVIPEASLADSGKRLDFEVSGEELSLCVFGGQTKIAPGNLCLLLLRVLPEVSAPGVIVLSNLDTQGANRDEKRVALSGNNGVIGVVGTLTPHKADQDGDWSISLPELLRIIQLYNIDSYHCDASSDDGYSPGPGDTACDPHDADYSPVDWKVSLTELLRLIQLYNSPNAVYHVLEGTEDGFAPGPFGITYD